MVLATGAQPIRPDLPGIDHPRVRTLRTVGDVDVLVDLVGSMGTAGSLGTAEGSQVPSALVVGGGYIGVEVAEALINRGLRVSLVELADQLLGPLDPEMAQEVSNELQRHGVDLRTGVGVSGFDDDAGDDTTTGAGVTGESTGSPAVRVRLSDGSTLRADLVLLAIGVRPDSRLARDAGLDVTDGGAVLVDSHQRTSDPAIYAAGDCVQVVDTVTGAGVVVPLAGPANRQGRIAADHIAGRSSAYRSTQGSAVVKAFEVTAGGTGASEKTLRRTGIDYRVVYVHPNGHAGYYPGTSAMHLKLLFAPADGRILGAQVVGRDGVDKRIDVLAVALRAGMTVFDLEELELAYAPPYGSAKDPVNMAGFQAANLLRGDVAFWYPQEWPTLPGGRAGRRRPDAGRARSLRVTRVGQHSAAIAPRPAGRTRPGPTGPPVLRLRFPVVPELPDSGATRVCRRVHPVRGNDDPAIGRSRPLPAAGWARAPARTCGFACRGHGGMPVGSRGSSGRLTAPGEDRVTSTTLLVNG